MMPSDWKLCRLDDIFRVVDSLHKTPKFSETGKPMVRVTDIKGGLLDLSNTVRVSDEVFREFTKNYLPKKNDIVFSRVGSYGISAYVATDDPFCLGQNTVIAESNSNANPMYIFNVLKSSYIKRQIERTVDGSSHKTVSLRVIRNLELPIPPLPEQQKIAKILTTWDKAINTTERLIENSKQQKKALMQQLFTGQKRLLDDSGQRFSGDWEEVKLKDITDFIKDGTHGTHKRYESGIPMLSAKNITKQYTVDFDDAPRISEEDYNKIHAKYTIQSGDILLTVVGTLGRVAIVPDDLAEKFTLQRSVAIIRVNERSVYNQFLKQLFSSSEFTNLLHRKSNSTAQAGIYLGELGKLKIHLPSLNEQQKIAAVLTNADREIEVLEQQLADLQQEKKALMQQLLTGKKRVLVD